MSSKNYYAINNLHKDDSLKFTTMAFGTEHAAAVSEDGLLYTWGHNHCEQLGITLQKHDEEAKTLQNSKQILTKIFYASINSTLLANKSR